MINYIMIDKIQTQRVLLPSVFKYSRVHLIKQPRNTQIDYSTLNLGISLPQRNKQNRQNSKQEATQQKNTKPHFFSNRVRNSVNYGSKQKLDKVNRSSVNLQINKFDSIIQCRRNITEFQQSKNKIVKIKNSLQNKHLISLQTLEDEKSKKLLKTFIQQNRIKFIPDFHKKYQNLQTEGQMAGKSSTFKQKSKKSLQLSIHSIKSVLRKKSKFQKYSQVNISDLLNPTQQKQHQHRRKKSMGKKVILSSIYNKKKTVTQQNNSKQKSRIFNRPETQMNIQLSQQLNPWQSVQIEEQRYN